jgi:uncharacterized RDD family membrane protein YckC
MNKELSKMNKSFEIGELKKTQEARYVYAGFWVRALGWFLDAFILTLVLTPIFISLMTLTGYNSEMLNQAKQISAPLQLIANFSFIFVAYIIPLIIQWLYFSIQYSSKYQATLGMRAFGLKIISDTGSPVSFSRATGRYFASFLSGAILFIGRLMAAFTPRKQTLHDIMAGTYVIRQIENRKE